MPVVTLTPPANMTPVTAYLAVNRWPGEPVHLMLIPLPVDVDDDDHPPGTVIITNTEEDPPSLAYLTELLDNEDVCRIYFSHIWTARHAIDRLADVAVVYVVADNG
ncbi:hypothetical protein L210DRAFT_3658009 [Boletus edulis BED1]|uniref:Uncharacterized protein n=1 Tax=Boletus edulis BED1 TaxID=1328754 RepID=A0AAD4BAU9_BOLED|nr:hypothetical protein L210DRAFT_3658009 [Boletus edulis BED1]